jgi:hypothetical protein
MAARRWTAGQRLAEHAEARAVVRDHPAGEREQQAGASAALRSLDHGEGAGLDLEVDGPVDGAAAAVQSQAGGAHGEPGRGGGLGPGVGGDHAGGRGGGGGMGAAGGVPRRAVLEGSLALASSTVVGGVVSGGLRGGQCR